MVGLPPKRLSRKRPAWPYYAGGVALAVVLTVSLHMLASGALTGPAAGKSVAHPSHGLGYLVGASLLPALLVWTPLFAAFLVKLRGPHGPASFAAMTAAALATNIVLQGGLASGGGGPTRTYADARMASLEQEYRGQLGQDTMDLDANLRATGLPELSDPQQLAHDRNFEHAAQAVAKARDVMTRYRALYIQRQAEERDTISQTFAEEDERRKAIQQFDAAVAKRKAASDRQWDLSQKWIDEQGQLIAMLQRGKAVWDPDLRVFLFRRPAGMDGFNALLSRSRQTVADLNAAAQAAQAQDQTPGGG